MKELHGRDATYSFLRQMTVEKALMGRKRGARDLLQRFYLRKDLLSKKCE